MANPNAEKSPFELVRDRLGEEMMATIAPMPVSKREFNEELKLWNSIFKTSDACRADDQQMPALALSKDTDSAWRAYENSAAGRRRRDEIVRSIAS
ncbi:hypothetical protein BH11CYA1_BH11CYA1_27180 [soil metagenome]